MVLLGRGLVVFLVVLGCGLVVLGRCLVVSLVVLGCGLVVLCSCSVGYCTGLVSIGIGLGLMLVFDWYWYCVGMACFSNPAPVQSLDWLG